MIDLRLPTCAVARRRSLCSFAFSDASGDGARFGRAHAESLEILAALDKYGYQLNLSPPHLVDSRPLDAPDATLACANLACSGKLGRALQTRGEIVASDGPEANRREGGSCCQAYYYLYTGCQNLISVGQGRTTEEACCRDRRAGQGHEHNPAQVCSDPARASAQQGWQAALRRLEHAEMHRISSSPLASAKE